MRLNGLFVLLIVSLCSAAFFGCASRTAGPYKPNDQAARDPYRAQHLTLEAVDLIGVDDARAEQLLCEALTADLFHGPAHTVAFLTQLPWP